MISTLRSARQPSKDPFLESSIPGQSPLAVTVAPSAKPNNEFAEAVEHRKAAHWAGEVLEPSLISAAAAAGAFSDCSFRQFRFAPREAHGVVAVAAPAVAAAPQWVVLHRP